MVKKIIAFLLLATLLQGQEPKSDIYQTNCLVCHKQLSFDLGTIFFGYLLKYSDEVSVKSALVDFLEHPNSDTSVMTKEYISSFGLKQKSELSKKELQEAIDVYWEKYTVFGKLR
jgi:hypothetical protein